MKPAEENQKSANHGQIIELKGSNQPRKMIIFSQGPISGAHKEYMDKNFGEGLFKLNSRQCSEVQLREGVTDSVEIDVLSIATQKKIGKIKTVFTPSFDQNTHWINIDFHEVKVIKNTQLANGNAEEAYHQIINKDAPSVDEYRDTRKRIINDDSGDVTEEQKKEFISNIFQRTIEGDAAPNNEEEA
jgi:hypothetical protein